MKKLLLLLTAVALFAIPGCGDDAPPTKPDATKQPAKNAPAPQPKDAC